MSRSVCTVVRTDLDIYTGFIPSQLMTNTSGCRYSLQCSWWWTQRASETCKSILVVVNKHNTARVASCWFIIYYRLVIHGNSNTKCDLPVRFCNMCFCNKCRRMRINYTTNHQTIYKNLEKNKFFLKERVEIFSHTTYIWFNGIIHILKIMLISFAGEGWSVTITLPTVNVKGSKSLLIQALHHFVKWN